MGDVIGLGLTHFPPLMGPDAGLSRALRKMISDPGMPEELRTPDGWPEEMRREWGEDEGLAAAAAHRERVVAGLRTVRAALDEFDPDLVVVVADDQYENFREQGVPAFCVQAFEDMELYPWSDGEQSSFASNNVWGEGPQDTISFRGARELGKRVATALIDRGFEAAYAYEPLADFGLSHAFMNTLLYLDYDRTGFDYPVLPVAVNCYGRFVISHRGRYPSLTESVELADLDPPGPQPWRCFDFGAALGRVLAELPGRVALVASSSWSHGFLTRAHNFLYPDVESDLNLYEDFSNGRFGALRELDRDRVEASGQHEFLNWVALSGAAAELGLGVEFSDLVTTRIFNSDKCFAVLG
jgi:catalytic LigB subunit of aromatic ring-opening dioxygenase